jgi:antitoxin (DNA-binding transcriptional repressor) of toxin-antitoxin stability system
MPEVVAAADLPARLPELLRRVREGETFLIEEGGEAIAQLSGLPVEGATWDVLVERLARVRTSDASFASDLEAIQAAQPPAEPPYPWPSS